MKRFLNIIYLIKFTLLIYYLESIKENIIIINILLFFTAIEAFIIINEGKKNV